MSRFLWYTASTVVGGLLLELLAPLVRERMERRRLMRRRRRFRQLCAGPEADYCELHGECHRCCEAAGGKGSDDPFTACCAAHAVKQ